MSDRLSIAFQGTKSGLVIAVDDSQPFQTMMGDLEHKLSDSGYFFVDAEVTLNLGERAVTEKDLKLIRQAIEGNHGLRIEAVKTESDETRAAAEVLGFKIISKAGRQATSQLFPEDFTTVVQKSRKRQANQFGELPTDLLRRSVRSGQIYETRGNLVILGDVNPGAELVAAGDILIFGALRGTAHAGATGKTDAVIGALNLRAMQLRICDKIARANDGPSDNRGPEFAVLENGQIVIDRWNNFQQLSLTPELI